MKATNLDARAHAWCADTRDKLDQGDYAALEDLARLFVEVRAILDTLKGASTEVQKLYDLIRINKIPDLMDEQGITTVTFEGLGRLTLTSDLRASIPKHVREGAYAWLEENGFGDLVTESINPSTLKAFCKRRIKDGEELPDDLFNVSPFSRASITKVS